MDITISCWLSGHFVIDCVLHVVNICLCVGLALFVRVNLYDMDDLIDDN